MSGRHRIPEHGVVPLRSRATVLVRWLTGRSLTDIVPTRHDGSQTRIPGSAS